MNINLEQLGAIVSSLEARTADVGLGSLGDGLQLSMSNILGGSPSVDTSPGASAASTPPSGNSWLDTFSNAGKGIVGAVGGGLSTYLQGEISGGHGSAPSKFNQLPQANQTSKIPLPLIVGGAAALVLVLFMMRRKAA